MEVQNETPRWIRRKVIGKGSYGVVSLGVRVDTGETFAVKSAEKTSVSSIEALENEIEILSSLSSSSSPFIVDYYGEEETATCRSLFMEYLPGGDVASGGKVDDVDLVRSYTWCLVTALVELHDKGIVHCDVKGSNVLLAGPTGVAKLADFGTAKRAGRGSKVVPRGSPLWMAPEVVRGESQGCESDVWALGCTVIEMFTGMPAWRDCGAHTLYRIGYTDELPEYPAWLPDCGRDFLDKCLVREPEKRWKCDQLLKHPFLQSTLAAGRKPVEASPRSVFDYLDNNVGFCEDDIDDDDSNAMEDEILIRSRIGNLATVSRVNWESDDWIDVRGTKTKRNEEVDVEIAVEDSDSNEVIIGSPAGIILEIDNANDSDTTWINLSIEIDDVHTSGGEDDMRPCDEGNNGATEITTIATTSLVLTILAITLYHFSRIIARSPNIELLLSIKINTSSLLLFSQSGKRKR